MIEKIPYWQSKKCPLSKRGIPPKYTKLTAEHINEAIIMYGTGKYNYKEIADKLNRSLSTIQRLLNKKGFKAKPQSELQRKYKINTSFFKNIDTEAKAYYLGFLYADGYHHVKSMAVRISLQCRDIEILKRFKKESDSNHPIKRYSIISKGVSAEYIRISIIESEISKDLIKHGCSQAKSFSIRMPNSIPPDLVRHFVRGYFDGDGNFSVSKKIQSNMTIGITSNKMFLSDIQNYMVEHLKLTKTKILNAANSDRRIGVLCYGGRNNCIKIRDWMYEWANVFLKRKRDKMYSI